MRANIILCCDNIKEMLMEKNKRYGNSSLEPPNIFSKAAAGEGILLRLDDKINRIINNPDPKPRTNDLIDIIGYIILYLVSQEDIDFSRFID
jgi:hypothetical protein